MAESFDLARRLYYPLKILGKIKEAFDRDPSLTNLLLDPYFNAG